MSLGQRIADLRRRRGLTSRELATGIQVTSSLIGQIEYDKTSPVNPAGEHRAVRVQVDKSGSGGELLASSIPCSGKVLSMPTQCSGEWICESP